ncbi:MAG: molybdopterin-dependent oxidoreductase [Actinomycetota bacterium]|nr:molybdopterin-dependent oxidoreductase [Actinomycetota bacterium]
MISALNGRRLERALPWLDLLVCFDYCLTETSRHADYIVPPASPLETSEYDVALSLLAVRNIAHFSPPMFEPPDGARHDWDALAGLTARLHAGHGLRGRAAGLSLATLVERLGVQGLLDAMIRSRPYGHGASLARALEQAMGASTPTHAAWRRLSAFAARGPWRAVLAAPSSRRPEGARATGLTDPARARDLSRRARAAARRGHRERRGRTGSAGPHRPPSRPQQQFLDAQQRPPGQGQIAVHADDPSPRCRDAGARRW